MLLTEILGWWAYLQRAPVQLQLLPLLLLGLGLFNLPRLWPGGAIRLKRYLPLRLVLLIAELLLALLMAWCCGRSSAPACGC